MYSLSQYKESKLLFQAAAFGQIDAMKSAIESKADPHFQDQTTSKLYRTDIPGYHLFTEETIYNTILHIAVLSDSPSILDYLIQDLGVNNFNIQDRAGFTAIAIAAYNNKPNAVKHLIEQYGVDPKERTSVLVDDTWDIKSLPLSVLALYSGNEELASYLLTLDPNAATHVGLAYLKLGNVQQFQSLLQSYDLVPQLIKEPKGALFAAIQSGSIEMVDYMVSIDEIRQLPQWRLQQGLILAISSSQFDIARHLITNLHCVIETFNNKKFKNVIIPIDFFEFVLLYGFKTRPNTHQMEEFIFELAGIGNFALVQHLIEHHNIDVTPTNNLYYQLLFSGVCTIEMINYVNGLAVDINIPAVVFRHESIYHKNNVDERLESNIFYIALNRGYSLNIIQYLVYCGADMISFIRLLPRFANSARGSAYDHVKKTTQIIGHDVVDYILNSESTRNFDMDMLVNLFVQYAIHQGRLDLVQHLDSKYSVKFSYYYIEDVLDRSIDSTDLLLYLFTKMKKLTSIQYSNIFCQMIQTDWVLEENIITFASQWNIDSSEPRKGNGKTLLHLIADSSQSIQRFEIVMNFSQDHNLCNVCDDRGQNVLFHLFPQVATYALNYQISISPHALQFFNHIVQKYEIDLHTPLPKSGYTLAHYAALSSDPTLMSVLIQHKVDINQATTKLYETPLYLAVSKCPNASVTKFLLQHKANIDIPYGSIINEIFRLRDDFIDVQKYLLQEHNIPPPVLTEFARDVLRASYSNHHHQFELFQLLLQHKANPRDCLEGGSLLHFAVGNADIVSLLINAKAPINFLDNYKMSALTLALDSSAYDVVKLLISANANINTISVGHFRDYDESYEFEETPLHAVIKRELNDDLRIDLVEHIIKHKGDINAINLSHETPFMVSLNFRKYDVIYYLLKHYANDIDLAIPDGNGQIPLHRTVTQPSEELFLSVLHGGDTSLCNQMDYRGKTPLLQAAQYGWNHHTSLLVDHGADPMVFDSNGQTTMHLLVLFIPGRNQNNNEEEQTEDEKMKQLVNDEDFRSQLLEYFINLTVKYLDIDASQPKLCPTCLKADIPHSTH